MNEVAVGINEDGLRSLCLEIEDYADRMSEIFDKIDKCINQLPSCYRGQPCSGIMDRYRELALFYPTIKSNVLSYSKDLNALVRKMKETDGDLSRMFENFTSDAEATKNNIINQGKL